MSSSSLSPNSLFHLQLMAFEVSFVLTGHNPSSSFVLEHFHQDFHTPNSTDRTLLKVTSDSVFGGFPVIILLTLSATVNAPSSLMGLLHLASMTDTMFFLLSF